MAKLILDGINLPIENVYEHITMGRLSASKSFGEGEEFPDISGLIGKTTLTTLQYVDENDEPLTLVGTYSKIDDFTVRTIGNKTSYDLTLSNGN